MSPTPNLQTTREHKPKYRKTERALSNRLIQVFTHISKLFIQAIPTSFKHLIVNLDV